MVSAQRVLREHFFRFDICIPTGIFSVYQAFSCQPSYLLKQFSWDSFLWVHDLFSFYVCFLFYSFRIHFFLYHAKYVLIRSVIFLTDLHYSPPNPHFRSLCSLFLSSIAMSIVQVSDPYSNPLHMKHLTILFFSVTFILPLNNCVLSAKAFFLIVNNPSFKVCRQVQSYVIMPPR